MFNTNVKGVSKELLLYVSILILLLLTSININNFLSPKKVLGAKSQQEINEEKFWKGFLGKNPTYVPGLIETGQFDKANKIDPNYVMP